MDVIQPILMGPTGYSSYSAIRYRRKSAHTYEFGPVDYDIFAPDLINIYIPPQAVFSDQLIVASTQIRIDATRGVLNMVGGTLLADRRESTLQDPGTEFKTVELLLRRDSWATELGQPQAWELTQDFLRGLRRRPDSRSPEPNGWATVVQPGLISACTSLDCSVVQRVNSEFLILTFPAFPEYEISYPETIELTATRDSVLSDQAILSETVLIMRPDPGTAHLTGTLVDATRMGLPNPLPIREIELTLGATNVERTLRSIERVNMSNFDVVKPVGSNLDLRIEIRNDTWKLTNDPNGPLDMEPAAKLALIRGLLSDKDECKGWNTMVMQYFRR